MCVFRSLEPFHCLLPHTSEAHCAIPSLWGLAGAQRSVHRRGNRGLREQLGWGGQHPQVQAFGAAASVLFLAHLGQIRMGSALSSHGKGLCGRFPTHLFLILWTLGQVQGRQLGGQESSCFNDLEAIESS